METRSQAIYRYFIILACLYVPAYGAEKDMQQPQLRIQPNPANGLQEILCGNNHVAWINTGGSIGPGHGEHPAWDLILNDVSLAPGKFSLYTFCHLMPLCMEKEGAKHKTDFRQKDGRIELAIEATDPTGQLSSKSLTVFEPDPNRKDQLRLRYSAEITVLNDLDAAKILKKEQPDPGLYLMEIAGAGPCWVAEMCDPWLDSVRGPSMKISQDFPFHIPNAGNESFTTKWAKKWQMYAFESPDGSVKSFDLAYEKLIRQPAKWGQLVKAGGKGGFFLESQGNPVSQFQSSDQVAIAICQWVYDAHFYVVIPFDAPHEFWNRATRFNDFLISPEQAAGENSILKKGRKITFNVTTVLYSEDEGRQFIAQASPLRLEDNEQLVYNGLPALTEGTSDFTTPVSRRPDAIAWTPASIAEWDKNIGHNKSGSLRITNSSQISEGAWTALGGRSNFCEPALPGKKYRLSGYIKTITASGDGASIEAEITPYHNLGKIGETKLDPITVQTKRLNRTNHWTYVEAVVGPLPKDDVAYVQLIARLKGRGTAWFDEITFEPIE
jgi:hypothetical protein